MSQYVSKFSGVNIDRAVAYYNDMQRIGRTILQVPIAVNDWVLATSQEDTKIGKYYVNITATGANAVSNAALGLSSTALAFPPQVYFLDDTGLRWEIEYRFAVENNSNYVRCFSNAAKRGIIVIVSILSNAILGSDSSFEDLYVSGNLTVGNLTVNGTIMQSSNT